MKALSIVSTVALFLILGQTLLASPQPPLYVVNHSTKECGTIMGGDECMDCYPLEGWQVVDRGEHWCPEGYAQVQNVHSRCEPFKDQFCCTEGHSGVPGDCRDLIRHDRQEQCAFVDDIRTAIVPEGWQRGPEDTTAYAWSCPNHYEWVSVPQLTPTDAPRPSEVPASTEAPEPTKVPEPTVAAEPTQMSEPTVAPVVTEVPAGGNTTSQSSKVPCLGAFLLAPFALGLVVVVHYETRDSAHKDKT